MFQAASPFSLIQKREFDVVSQIDVLNAPSLLFNELSRSFLWVVH